MKKRILSALVITIILANLILSVSAQYQANAFRCELIIDSSVTQRINPNDIKISVYDLMALDDYSPYTTKNSGTLI